MTKPVEIEVVLSYSERLPVVDVWLVVDILRASTVMVSWFAAGGGDLYPTDSPESAERLAKLLRQEGLNPVLMGEQNAIAPSGFDLGNSPLDITRELTQKHDCAVMATTNGTKSLLKAASTGTPVLVACARNAFYALDSALSKGSRLGIFCSGRSGRPAWDDTLCAGLLIGRLTEYFPDVRLADSARLALLTWRNAKNLLSSLRTADHAVFLDKIGFGRDIVFAAETDAARSVPELHELSDGEGMRAVLREGFPGEAPLVLQGPPAANAYLPLEPEQPLKTTPKPEDNLFCRVAEIHAANAAASHIFFPASLHKKRPGP
ncbi:MAG: 2-phosphosulfolactate phosphatase [Synergistaceae bacterium]|jgi:2-phosphosulfolactate phosphatase|nr:2-phosphosulfolactate phosphatase [Synergistaceae bacterium]